METSEAKFEMEFLVGPSKVVDIDERANGMHLDDETLNFVMCCVFEK